MGGAPGWGPAHPPDRDEPVFAEPWQGRAFACTPTTSSHARTRLPGAPAGTTTHTRTDRQPVLTFD
jgi:hypothetical protein